MRRENNEIVDVLSRSQVSFLRLAGAGVILTAVVEVLTMMIAGTSEGRHQSLITASTRETISRGLTAHSSHQTFLPAAPVMLAALSERTGVSSTEDIA